MLMRYGINRNFKKLTRGKNYTNQRCQQWIHTFRNQMFLGEKRM